MTALLSYRPVRVQPPLVVPAAGPAPGAPPAARPLRLDRFELALLAVFGAISLWVVALDVFHAEPLRPDHPLASMVNVTLSAHAAFRTLEASMTLLRRAIDIVRGIVTKSQ